MILDVFLHAAKSSQQGAFLWHYIKPFKNTLFSDVSDVSLKRTAILALSYTSWDTGDSRDLVRAWVETVSAIPKEEEVAPSVVDALLQMAYFDLLLPGNHGDVWSWLTLRPSLPPICRGRYLGSDPKVMRQVRGLKDIEILKSYFLVVWSEWDTLYDSGFHMMCKCIREEFSGVEANSHRAELMQRLDEVIGEVDKGLEYLQRDRPDFWAGDLRQRKGQYEKLRKILKEIPEAPEIPNCMSPRSIKLFDLLTVVEHAQNLTRYLYVRSLRRIRSRLLGTLGHRPPSLYRLSVRTPPSSFIVSRFPFTLLIAPQVFATSSSGPTSRPLQLFVNRHLSTVRHC